MNEKFSSNPEGAESEELREMIDAEVSAMRSRQAEAEAKDEAATHFKNETAERNYAKARVLKRLADSKDKTSLESGD